MTKKITTRTQAVARLAARGALMPSRRPKVGGRRAGAGRKPSGGPVRDRQVMLRLTEAELAAAQAAAIADGRVNKAGEPVISDWYRAAGELAIARGSTR